jgi:hypothetical protein
MRSTSRPRGDVAFTRFSLLSDVWTFAFSRFNMGGKEENAIVTSTGQYVVAWDFDKVKKGLMDKYEIKRYGSPLSEWQQTVNCVSQTTDMRTWWCKITSNSATTSKLFAVPFLLLSSPSDDRVLTRLLRCRITYWLSTRRISGNRLDIPLEENFRVGRVL